ncbi:24094_t:CDS:2, partial [Gigaspora margarita]
TTVDQAGSGQNKHNGLDQTVSIPKSNTASSNNYSLAVEFLPQNADNGTVVTNIETAIRPKIAGHGSIKPSAQHIKDHVK